MTDEAKPAPQPDLDSAPFWEACRAHQLKAQRCLTCSEFRWTPQAFCPHCYSWDYEWAGLSGRGSVASCVVVHYVAVPAFKDEAPYVVANITLDGTGGRVCMLSNVVGCPPEDVRVGMPVSVFFDDIGRDASLPKFRPE